MSDYIDGLGTASSAGMATQRASVMRNTFWLLGLSMIPTALGAWLGVEFGLARMFSGMMGMVVFLAGAFGFMFAIEKTKNSAAGVPVLLSFTFFMGVMLSGLISSVLGFRNGPQLIMTAFAGTGGVFLGMAVLASVVKRPLGGLASFLSIGALVLLVGCVVNAFVGSTAGMLAISVAAIAIFSGYLFFDLRRIVDGGESNYISATLRLYLSLYNIFQSLLMLLGVFGGERD